MRIRPHLHHLLSAAGFGRLRVTGLLVHIHDCTKAPKPQLPFFLVEIFALGPVQRVQWAQGCVPTVWGIFFSDCSGSASLIQKLILSSFLLGCSLFLSLYSS